MRFGTRTVLAVEGTRATYRCDCGHVASADLSHLRRYPNGTCRRCASRVTSSTKITHGHTRAVDGRPRRTPEYAAWESMLQRCRDPEHAGYKRYGGRGIAVAEEWIGVAGFARFLAHIGPRPSRGFSIDRKKNSLGYEPGNVRWATRKEQQRNRDCNRLVTAHGKTLCVAEWAERLACAPSAIHDRLDDGWSEEDAVMRPVKKYRPRMAAAIEEKK